MLEGVTRRACPQVALELWLWQHTGDNGHPWLSRGAADEVLVPSGDIKSGPWGLILPIPGSVVKTGPAASLMLARKTSLV